MSENPKYAELMDALSREIEHGAAMICIWDYDHGNPAPRAIFGDDMLLKIASRHGKPLYLAELPGRDDLIDTYAFSDDAEVKAKEQELITAHTIDSHYIPVLKNMRAGKITLQSPDPRGASMAAFKKALNAEELALLNDYIAAVQDDHPGKAGDQSYQEYWARLTPAQQTTFVTMKRGMDKIASGGDTTTDGIDTTQLDRGIAKDIRQARNSKSSSGHATVMLFGAEHFMKAVPDLNELSLNAGERSVSVAVIEGPVNKNPVILSSYQQGRKSDLPDYVFYSNGDRLVKLDNDIAKAEFLGIKPVQVAMFEKTGIYPQTEQYAVQSHPAETLNNVSISAGSTAVSQAAPQTAPRR